MTKLLALLLLLTGLASAQEITVAAAADMSAALPQIARHTKEDRPGGEALVRRVRKSDESDP